MPELRPYQIEDINFLSAMKVSGCFNEQRTGKTPTSLFTMRKLGRKKLLIICPASAVYQWAEDYQNWLGEPCVAMVGTQLKKQKLLQQWTHGLVVSYDSFKSTERYTGMGAEILKLSPDGVILDEAHRIKNTKSAAAKAAHTCKAVPYRMALTGTPAPNKAYEIYSILNWLYPNYFSSYWKFIDKYFNKVSLPNGRGQNYIDIRGFKPGMETELQLILSKISTQRKRKEVMPWLPDKDYQRIKLPPTTEQIKYLKELESYFETEHVITQGILDRLVRYRQICLAPQLLGLKGASPKTEWVLQYLTDYPEKPIIIFSKFTSYIKTLTQVLLRLGKEIGVIIGETPIKTRNNVKKDFQSGKLNILIINIDAGKESLTLDRAETIIFTDKYPPVGDIAQAEDRFVATTEDKADKPHTIIELMIKGTYDEELYKHIAKLERETDIINDYKKYLEGRNASGRQHEPNLQI